MSLLGTIANKEIFNFLRTATIKNSYFADQSRTNQVKPSLTDKVPDIELPYYKHVAGEYILKEATTVTYPHAKTGAPLTISFGNLVTIYNNDGTLSDPRRNDLVFQSTALDEVMMVTSLDRPGETIPFCLETLHKDYASDPTAVHTKTLEAYKLPGKYYDLLCKKYPSQIDLIKAIVYPVKTARDYTASEISLNKENGEPLPSLELRRREYLVSASNFEILNYDTSLLEENERESLTTAMSEFVAQIADRWNVSDYTFEENYPIVLWSIIWSLLPAVLIIQRYENIRTPVAHSSHIWDYLMSKGLESYRGYLTTEQSLFLYKNIEYILKHRGQQRTTNLISSRLLNDVGVTIKTKTVVMDTTDTKEMIETANEDIKTQCNKCSRRSKCHKKVDTHICPDFLGLDDMCKPEPIVLTENFSGATEEKILRALVTQYGYSEEDAIAKYKRSFLWRDDEITEITEALDRDQLTDLSGDTETVDALIKREYKSGLEPIYDSSVVEQQRHDLRHINGTYAPTKILELVKNTTSAKFRNLFMKYLTETFLHLCAKDVNGYQKLKCIHSYNFNVDGVAGAFSLDIGEMMALLYLGTVREYSIELFYDHVRTEETYQAGTTYYKISSQNGNRMTSFDTSEKIGDPVEAGVYRWAPKDEYAELPEIVGHELITAMYYFDEETQTWMHSTSYDFPIPDQVRLTTAFKFTKPVTQNALVNAWFGYSEEDQKYKANMPNDVERVLKLNGMYYGVKKTTTPSLPIWDRFSFALEIVGILKGDEWIDNDGEIPVIPHYFKWHCKHLVPDNAESTTTHESVKQYIPDGTFSINGPVDPIGPEDFKTTVLKFEDGHKDYYKEYVMSEYIDVDDLIDMYYDLTGVVQDHASVAAFISSQFELIEKLHCLADVVGSAKVHEAINTFMDACMYRGDIYRVNLTGTERRTTWPKPGTYKYTPEKTIKVATYADWLRVRSDLRNTIKTIDESAASMDIWNTLNSAILNQLTTDCVSPYLPIILDNTTTRKLKELVQHLSTYKIAFINNEERERVHGCIPQIIQDPNLHLVKEKSCVFISPLHLSTCRPHPGGYMINGERGFYYAHTKDTSSKEGKTYYVAVMKRKDTAGTPGSEVTVVGLDLDSVSYEPVDIPVNTLLDPYKYYEKINFYDLLGIPSRSTPLGFKRIEIKHVGTKWYYRVGTPEEIILEVPACILDNEVFDAEGNYLKDTYLPFEIIDPTLKVRLQSNLYRKYVEYIGVKTWSDFVESDILKHWLDYSVSSGRVVEHNSFSVADINITAQYGVKIT